MFLWKAKMIAKLSFLYNSFSFVGVPKLFFALKISKLPLWEEYAHVYLSFYCGNCRLRHILLLLLVLLIVGGIEQNPGPGEKKGNNLPFYRPGFHRSSYDVVGSHLMSDSEEHYEGSDLARLFASVNAHMNTNMSYMQRNLTGLNCKIYDIKWTCKELRIENEELRNENRELLRKTLGLEARLDQLEGISKQRKARLNFPGYEKTDKADELFYDCVKVSDSRMYFGNHDSNTLPRSFKTSSSVADEEEIERDARKINHFNDKSKQSCLLEINKENHGPTLAEVRRHIFRLNHENKKKNGSEWREKEEPKQSDTQSDWTVPSSPSSDIGEIVSASLSKFNNSAQKRVHFEGHEKSNYQECSQEIKVSPSDNIEIAGHQQENSGLEAHVSNRLDPLTKTIIHAGKFDVKTESVTGKDEDTVKGPSFIVPDLKRYSEPFKYKPKYRYEKMKVPPPDIPNEKQSTVINNNLKQYEEPFKYKPKMPLPPDLDTKAEASSDKEIIRRTASLNNHHNHNERFRSRSLPDYTSQTGSKVRRTNSLLSRMPSGFQPPLPSKAPPFPSMFSGKKDEELVADSIHEPGERCKYYSKNELPSPYSKKSKLMEMFPEDAGSLDPRKRIIPFLPGKKFFGRSHIREVAMKRMAPIAEYCKTIVKLPRKISQSKEVLDFFDLEPDDIDPPKDKKKPSIKANKITSPKALEHYIACTEYKKQEKGEITLKVGMLVEVMEKTETGWWFVTVEDEQGWVPSTCLEREDGVKEESSQRFKPGEEEQYLCTEEFVPQGEDELGLERGAVVDVVEKNLEGWWVVRYNGKEGYVPATYLMKSEAFSMKKTKVARTSVGGPEIVKTLHDISDLLKEEPKQEAEQEEKCFTIQELSKILKEDKRGTEETEKVYECIENIKSRSLKRGGSTRPPPRPSMKPRRDGKVPVSQRVSLVRAESVSKEYITVADFADAVGDGINFKAGEIVKVLEKSDGGWWYIEIGDKEGWAPATYIEESSQKPGLPSYNPKNSKMVREDTEDIFTSDSESESDEDVPNQRSGLGGLGNALKTKLSATTSKPPPPAPGRKEIGSGSVGIPKEKLTISSIDIGSKPKPPPPPPKQVTGDKDTSGSDVKPAFPIHLKHVEKETPKQGTRSKQDETQKIPLRMNQPPPPPPPSKGPDTKEPIKKAGLPIPSKQAEKKVPFQDDNKRLGGSKEAREPNEELSDIKSNVKGLAGALKAKFESDPVKSTNTTDTNKTVVPSDLKRPTFGDAGVKSSQGPKKPWLSKAEPPKLSEKPKLVGNEPFKKPDFNVKDNNVRPSKTVDKEVTGGKVSDLASVLKSKFENRQTANDNQTNSEENEKCSNISNAPNTPQKPVNVLRPNIGTKPPRPVTPPSPKLQQKPGHLSGLRKSAMSATDNRNSDTNLNEGSVAKLSAILGGKENKDLDPTKYSSRPLPPKPESVTSSIDNKDTRKGSAPNIAGKPTPNLPVKPKANMGYEPGAEQHSAFRDDSKPPGVAGLASALKAKLEIGKPSNAGMDHKTFDTNSKPVFQKNKPITANKPKPGSNIVSHNVSDNGLINDDVQSEALYSAIADFPGENEGEISLDIGVHVKLLERADPWWYVAYDSKEGWAPASYFEEVKSARNTLTEQSNFGRDHIIPNKKPAQHKKAVFRTCSDFSGENEGEISFTSGEEVTVLEKPEGGWWYIQIGKEEGWAPESYLEEIMV